MELEVGRALLVMALLLLALLTVMWILAVTRRSPATEASDRLVRWCASRATGS